MKKIFKILFQRAEYGERFSIVVCYNGNNTENILAGIAEESAMKIINDGNKKLWKTMAILLLISSVFGFAAFLVGRAAYGKAVEKAD